MNCTKSVHNHRAGLCNPLCYVLLAIVSFTIKCGNWFGLKSFPQQYNIIPTETETIKMTLYNILNYHSSDKLYDYNDTRYLLYI